MTHPSPETVKTRTCNGNLQVEIAFLEEASRYFENRPTHDEDRAHWSNVHNAENCRKVISSLTRETARADAAEKELQESIDAQDVLHDALEAAETARDAAVAEAKALREAALDLLKNDGGGMGDYNAGRALIARWVLAIRTGHRVIFSAPEAIRGEVATTLAQPAADGGAT